MAVEPRPKPKPRPRGTPPPRPKASPEKIAELKKLYANDPKWSRYIDLVHG